jgi:hypothetical protein
MVPEDQPSSIASTFGEDVCCGNGYRSVPLLWPERDAGGQKETGMTIDLTRRTLLHLAGASSLSAAAIAAAQAEGAAGGGPTFANRTPMRIGKVNLRVRNLDLVADYYRDATTMSNSIPCAGAKAVPGG